MLTICVRCSREYKYDRKKGHRKGRCNSCNVALSRKKKKLKAVQYKGGKCLYCGYNRNVTALHFHPRDPKTKSFSFSAETGFCRSWARVMEELEKCDLVCSNCHSEIHHPECTEKGLHLKRLKIIWPLKDELERLVWKMPTVQLAKKLSVSDVAISKRCKKYGIEKPPRGYWQKKYAGKM